MKVAVGLSGGVDSSVSCLRLLEAGYEVVAVTMRMIPDGPLFGGSREEFHRAAEDAARVAKFLGIEHVVLDMKDFFERTVIDYFVNEYAEGRTPNPCIYCNRTIKFGKFFDAVKDLGTDKIATGHYARTCTKDGVTYLRRAPDAVKDQTYFLYRLTSDVLSRVLFPVGELTKNEVRAIAREAGLPTASRSDSEEICFVKNMSAGHFVSAYRPEGNRSGHFRLEDGTDLGRHNGIVHYTVGQRKGLGIAYKVPLYVKEIRADGDILLAEREETSIRKLVLGDTVFPTPSTRFPFRAEVKVRHGKTATPATIEASGDEVHVHFDEAIYGVAKGQSAVFYRDDLVVGGGVIEAVSSE